MAVKTTWLTYSAEEDREGNPVKIPYKPYINGGFICHLEFDTVLCGEKTIQVPIFDQDCPYWGMHS
jgi:hypothetical protein